MTSRLSVAMTIIAALLLTTLLAANGQAMMKDGNNEVILIAADTTAKLTAEQQEEKENRRELETAVKFAVSELQGLLDNLGSKNAIVLLSPSGKIICLEHENSSPGRTCKKLYQMPVSKKYSTIEDVVDAFVIHGNEGKRKVSPYDGSPLFTLDPKKKAGHVLIDVIGKKTIVVSTWFNDSPPTMIMKSMVMYF